MFCMFCFHFRIVSDCNFLSGTESPSAEIWVLDDSIWIIVFHMGPLVSMLPSWIGHCASWVPLGWQYQLFLACMHASGHIWLTVTLNIHALYQHCATFCTSTRNSVWRAQYMIHNITVNVTLGAISATPANRVKDVGKTNYIWLTNTITPATRKLTTLPNLLMTDRSYSCKNSLHLVLCNMTSVRVSPLVWLVCVKKPSGFCFCFN